MIDRILEQEEAAAELLAGAFPRVVQLTLGEPATAPLPSVTPIGKPTERGEHPAGHLGPQSFKDVPADGSIGQPPHVDTPTDGPAPPGPAYPSDDTEPYEGGRVGGHAAATGAPRRSAPELHVDRPGGHLEVRAVFPEETVTLLREPPVPPR